MILLRSSYDGSKLVPSMEPRCVYMSVQICAQKVFFLTIAKSSYSILIFIDNQCNSCRNKDMI